MSLDDLLTLLIIGGLVLSFISRALRGRRPGAPSAPPTQQPTPRPSERAGSAGSERIDDAFERRLEEARARVASARAPSTPTSAPGRADATTVITSQLEPAAPLSWETEGARRALMGDRPLETSQPMQVLRNRARKRAKLSADLVRVDREEVLRGIIWQQILNEPRAKQPFRREPYRRP